MELRRPGLRLRHGADDEMQVNLTNYDCYFTSQLSRRAFPASAGLSPADRLQTEMPHHYRASIGRENLRPASRGDFAQAEPRRRNYRQIISLAARTQVGKAIFASFCLLTKGRGCPASGKGVLPVIGRHTFVRVCGVKTFRMITHVCRAAPPFWPKPEKIKGALLREGTFRVMRETPTGTASRRFLLRFGSPAPDWLGGNLFLLMRLRARDTFFR